MLRIHAEMHAARYKDHTEGDAILPEVIAKEVSAGRLLCFDEFQVTDVADALILQRLFTGLWQHGCVVVATSNRPPEDLYLNGLQRDRFVPFIHELKKHCEVVNMFESETDYRLMLKGMDNEISPLALQLPTALSLHRLAGKLTSFAKYTIKVAKMHGKSLTDYFMTWQGQLLWPRPH
jgi:predicted ATPase